MLEPVMDILDKQRVVLASSSPRRQELLKSIGLKFEVIPSLYEEDLNPSDFNNIDEFVISTAANKVKEVEERLSSKGEMVDIIIGADTMVSFENKLFGKPKTEKEAFKMLKALSGRQHTVFSGVCISYKEQSVKFCEKTNVEFGDLSDDVIQGYIRCGEPMDKAGGYGIQGKGATLIKKVDGDYFNVVGLPLHSVCRNILNILRKI